MSLRTGLYSLGIHLSIPVEIAGGPGGQDLVEQRMDVDGQAQGSGTQRVRIASRIASPPAGTLSISCGAPVM